MGYDSFGYEVASSNVGPGLGTIIWLVIALILSLVGCFFIYFMFVKKDNKLKNNKLAWLRTFLRFDNMLIESILKISYIFFALLITLGSFVMITSFVGLLDCVLTIVIGNIILRIIYEGILIKIMIWKNTTEIKQKLK